MMGLYRIIIEIRCFYSYGKFLTPVNVALKLTQLFISRQNPIEPPCRHKDVNYRKFILQGRQLCRSAYWDPFIGMLVHVTYVRR